MPESRLLPPERRSATSVAPTTSVRWRTRVRLRAVLNRHRRHWLAPLLVCLPPIGVAMVWAGASRPGHRRRWLTAAGSVWTLLVLLAVVLVATPGVPRAAADAPGTGSTPGRAPAAAAAVVVALSPSAPAAGPDTTPVMPVASVAAPTPSQVVVTPRAGVPRVASPAAPAVSAAPAGPPPPPVPTPTRAAPKPQPTPPTPPRPAPPARPVPAPHPPRAVVANPFSPCVTEGSAAVSPHGWPLRCERTPIGLFWLWSQ